MASASSTASSAHIEQAKLLWSFQTQGAIWSTPAVVNGIVYFGSDDQFLYAVENKTQKLKWKFKTNGIVRSQPAIDGDMIFIASDDGFLYALNIETGNEVWKINIGNTSRQRILPSKTGATFDYKQSSPVISNHIVYIGSADSHIYALNAKTGKIKWKFKTRGMVRATPAFHDGTLYIGSWIDGALWSSTLFAIDAATGKEKWHFDGCGDQPAPVVQEGLIYIGGRDAYFYALDVKNGSIKWSNYFDASWVESTAKIVDDSVFVGSSDIKYLYAMDKNTGNIKWKFRSTGWPWSSPDSYDHKVFIGYANLESYGERAGLYAVDMETGKEIWYFGTDKTLDTSDLKITGVVSSPTVSDGVVYFGGLDGKLYALSAS